MPKHIDIALYRPTSASGFMAGHSASLANDGNRATAWFAPEGERDPWWQVDLEGEFDIKNVSVTFPVHGPIRARLRLSRNARTWSPSEEIKLPGGSRTADILLPHPKRARFVRITLVHAPPDGRGISEVVIHGKVAD